MNVILKTNEYIENLQFNGLQIILNTQLPSFTTDAVLLSDFSKLKSNDVVCDLGTGTGILPILIYGRYNAKVTGFEIQPSLCDMAGRSFILNGIDDYLNAICIDIKDAYKSHNGKFTALVCNPPYFNNDSDLASTDKARAISRICSDTTLNDFMCASNKLLKSGGKAYFCYPAAKLCDLICCLRNNSLEPKRIRFVRSKQSKSPYLILVEAKKDGGKGNICFENDLIIYNENNTETEEIKRIYHRD